MKKLLISFSGGRTSAFMCKLILEHPKYKGVNKLFVYANTGKEKEETLIFIDKCDNEFNLNLVWVEADIPPEKGIGTKFKVVDFNTASRNGEPFDDLIRKFGLPSKYYRHCTRDLKQIPIEKYAKSIFDGEYITAIGIRADEKHRLGSDPKKIYPLSDIGIDEKIVRDFWAKQSFDLGIKDYQGNCDLCFLKSLRKKLTMINEDESIIDWWRDKEDEFGNEKQSKFDSQRGLYISDLLKMSKLPFRKARDLKELRDEQGLLFEPDMDIEFDCFCKIS